MSIRLNVQDGNGSATLHLHVGDQYAGSAENLDGTDQWVIRRCGSEYVMTGDLGDALQELSLTPRLAAATVEARRRAIHADAGSATVSAVTWYGALAILGVALWLGFGRHDTAASIAAGALALLVAVFGR